jgi:hypothetical protein
MESSLSWVVKLAVRTLVGRYFLEQVSSSGVMGRTRLILHRGVELMFVVTNTISHFRIDSFSIKEP